MPIEYDGLRFERPGHASVRIGGDDRVIYVDPWSEVIENEPGDADVVLLTHDDFDHYDPEGVSAVAGPDVTVAAFDGIDVEGLPENVVELPHEGETVVAGIDVVTVPAYNDPDGDHVDDAGEPFHAEGEGVGLLLTIDGTTVFLPSDTDFLPHHGSIAADVFVPPIGGHYTMDRHEAAEFARSVDPGLVLPTHYDTFEPIETDVGAFVDELESDGIRVEQF